MGIEIERKFLVRGESWREGAIAVRYRQGYICAGLGRTVRVRTRGDEGILTIKGRTSGIARIEYEYPIPLAEAEYLLEILCDQPLIDKYRFRVDFQGFTWEVDEFLGENQGLIMAEIELAREDQAFPIPPWAGREVSGDSRYFNASLAHYPFSLWRHGEPEAAGHD